MVDDNIYISLSTEEQRKYRSELLLAQTEVLNLMKKILSLKEIRDEKTKYRLKLAKETALVLEGIKRFNEKIPKPKLPKHLLEKVSLLETEENETDENEYVLDENVLENELQEIQEQLKKINQ